MRAAGQVREPRGARLVLDDTWSERCRAVPVGIQDGALLLLCGEPVADGELQAAATALGVSFSLFIAPEVRLAAARQEVFGRPMPPGWSSCWRACSGPSPCGAGRRRTPSR